MELNKTRRGVGCKGVFLRAFFIFARFFSLDHHQRGDQCLISLKQKSHKKKLGKNVACESIEQWLYALTVN
jgi:hypothetical protein